jgi:hypothetical protein
MLSNVVSEVGVKRVPLMTNGDCRVMVVEVKELESFHDNSVARRGDGLLLQEVDKASCR